MLYVKQKLWHTVFDSYLGFYFTIKADANITIDYSKILVKMKSIDASLFEILERFWVNWKKIDPKNHDAFILDYRVIVFEFTTEIKNWLLSKSV